MNTEHVKPIKHHYNETHTRLVCIMSKYKSDFKLLRQNHNIIAKYKSG